MIQDRERGVAVADERHCAKQPDQAEQPADRVAGSVPGDHHADRGEQHGEDEVAKLVLLGVAGGRGAGCHDDASQRH